jgi:glycerol-3-phosphate dehydrogenase
LRSQISFGVPPHGHKMTGLPLAPEPRLGHPLAEGHPYLRAEVAYAVTHENALHVDDVLMRRTRLSIEAADGGAEAAADVSAIMGRLLGWNRRRRLFETGRYLAMIEAEQSPITMHPYVTLDSKLALTR